MKFSYASHKAVNEFKEAKAVSMPDLLIFLIIFWFGLVWFEGYTLKITMGGYVLKLNHFSLSPSLKGVVTWTLTVRMWNRVQAVDLAEPKYLSIRILVQKWGMVRVELHIWKIWLCNILHSTVILSVMKGGFSASHLSGVCKVFLTMKCELP